MNWIVERMKPNSIVPALLYVTDIAGLVKGASENKGLGNEFLSHISAVDAIFHLVRLFPDPATGRRIEHVENSIDPVRDMEIISQELLYKDMQKVKARLDKQAKVATRSGDALKKKQLESFEKAYVFMQKGLDIREGVWEDADVEALNELGLLTAKPVVYLLNTSADDFLRASSPELERVRSWIAKRSPGATSILFSGDWESDLQLVEPEDKMSYIQDALADVPGHMVAPDTGIKPNSIECIDPIVNEEEKRIARALVHIDNGEGNGGSLDNWSDLLNAALRKAMREYTMLPAIITSGYKALGLIHYFTAGEQEVRAWSLLAGSTAPQAAGLIHSDIEKNFVCAEVMAFNDLRAHGSEQEVKKAGKLKTQGKTYAVQDGDVILFKHSAGKK